MSTELQVPIPREGPKALLAFLRDHPEERFKQPRELCDRFSLPEEFVVKVLHRAEPQVIPRAPKSARFYGEVYQGVKRLKRARDRAAQHPTTFVVSSTLVAEFILLVVSLVTRKPAINLGVTGNTLSFIGLGAAVPFVAVCLQMALFFRKGMVRFALYGALAYWIVGGIPLATLEWFKTESLPTSSRVTLALLILLAHFAISTMYAAVGTICSLLGEYRRILRENRRVERMSRQELLERLFQLEARMESARNETVKPVRFSKVTTFFKPRLLLTAACMGLIMRTLSQVTLGPEFPHAAALHHGAIPTFFFVSVGASVWLLNIATVMLLAYIAPNLATALFVGIVYSVGEIIAHFIYTVHAQGVPSLAQSIFIVELVIMSVEYIGLSALSGIVGAIQTKTLEEFNLQRNDEASLIAEQLRIQWRLAEKTCDTTVMVVDVVRSTQMKEGADPLEVEYSFRKFQTWIADIALSHGGEVTSIAGDGAVLSFPNCHNAFLSAQEIQRRMSSFNQSWNRLATRFRVRIGLHVGEVHADLGKVQFAQVIDIAAHLQKLAPAGGVAVTSEIVDSLGASSFVPLAVKSDSRNVFLAMNPSGL
jgi:class 3 adenylate cyclase